MHFYWREFFSSVQLNVHHIAESCTVEPLYDGHLGAILKYQDFQVSLYAETPCGTVPKCEDYAHMHVLILKCPDFTVYPYSKMIVLIETMVDLGLSIMYVLFSLRSNFLYFTYM